MPMRMFVSNGIWQNKYQYSLMIRNADLSDQREYFCIVVTEREPFMIKQLVKVIPKSSGKN